MPAIFSTSQSFLEATISETGPHTGSMAITNGQLMLRGPGVLQLETGRPEYGQLIISAGIHGDETAPIEMVDELVSSIINGELLPVKRCLFILGNPQAMKQFTRFIDENLNRLFKNNSATSTKSNYEAGRARLIMESVRSFYRQESPLLHYDLHTAIRPSRIEKFAVFPFLPARECPAHQLTFLARSDIEAILIQNKTSTTFSSWTSTEFGAESFTLELGKVKKFGENNPRKLSELKHELSKLLISKNPLPEKEHQPDTWPRQFSVVHEIINQGNNFTLNITDNTPNFTEYPNSYTIWSNENESYQVSDGPVAIVFPNARVGKGQRAGLLVKSGMPSLI